MFIWTFIALVMKLEVFEDFDITQAVPAIELVWFAVFVCSPLPLFLGRDEAWATQTQSRPQEQNHPGAHKKTLPENADSRPIPWRELRGPLGVHRDPRQNIHIDPHRRGGRHHHDQVPCTVWFQFRTRTQYTERREYVFDRSAGSLLLRARNILRTRSEYGSERCQVK